MKPPLADPDRTGSPSPAVDAPAVRPARRDDAPAMRELLDEIVRRGGTTAIERTPGIAELADWFIDGEGCLACFVAESSADAPAAGRSAVGPGGGPNDGSAAGPTSGDGAGRPSPHATLLGFQALGTHDALPPGCADIATFVRVGHAGRGIGTALFERTATWARELDRSAPGLETLNATIRADNAGGLAFYSRLGFADHEVEPAVPLSDGTPIDRVSKRFTL